MAAAEPAMETVTKKETVLSVANLKKSIGNKEIIKGISFDVYAGEVFGFLGPNGSGKTTTIRMLVDLIKPTSGNITVCGIPVHKRPSEALLHIGCIVENPELYAYLSGQENLEHFARMLPDVGETRIKEVVAIVGMEKRIHDKVKTYSLGMRQRLGIAQALLGRPKLLILDEPTNGLDPLGIKEMREFIRELASGGLSVLVSSHLLSEIQLMCDRVAIISHGSVLAVGEVAQLISETESTVIWKVEPFQQGVDILRQIPDIQIVDNQVTHRMEQGISSTTDDLTAGECIVRMNKQIIPQANQKLVEAGIQVHAIIIKNSTLEDLFLQLTEGERID